MINFLCGLFSGVVTGFGVGGGLILIMLLNWVTDFSQLEVQTINLLYYIPTAIFSVWVYSKKKRVDYKLGFKFIVTGGMMAVIGAIIAHKIDIFILKKLFAIYLIFVGVYFLISSKKLKKQVLINWSFWLKSKYFSLDNAVSHC